MRLFAIAAAVLFGIASVYGAEAWKGNHDENAVKPYSLPDPLTYANGKTVRSAEEWKRKRRPELLKFFADEVYGRTPTKRLIARYKVHSISRDALGGKAIRKLTTISFKNQPHSPEIHVLLYLPAGAKGPVPVFLSLNFMGNHTVDADPGIPLADVWSSATDHKVASEDTRARQATRWVIPSIIARGYGVATAYYGDIEPDFPGALTKGVRGMFLKPGEREFAANEWGAIGAWAWGMSRIADYLQTDHEIDPKRIALMGHSRIGKAALWAGAQDERFSIVISNDSGEGGAALSKRNFGEDVWRLNNNFPHWFARNYKKYANHEPSMPFDHHELLALMAPRPLYVASAAEDLHSDPKGEFLSAYHAGPVYGLFGKKGLGTNEMPAIHQPIMHDIGYHIREGKHDVTQYDWDRYCDFADLHWRKK